MTELTPTSILVACAVVAIACAWYASVSASNAPTSGAAKKSSIVDKTRAIALSEIATHDSVDDLWVIIDDGVYDLTEYAGEHPGGVEAIAKNAGGDATRGFKGTQHPSRVFDIVEDYKIGVVKRD